jgi:protein-tyrosine kinase
MSRIHEALKKAEQERAGVQVTDAGPIAPDTMEVETTAAFSMSDSTVASIPEERLSAAATVSSLPGAYLRFEDLRTHCSHPEWNLDPNVNIFFNPALSPRGAEQFRTLRSRLYQIRANQPLRSVLITSSVPGEGKTFITSNLAQAIVRQPDRRVLIIDADLRCPRLHVPLGAPNSPGLTDYLRGTADETAVIQQGREDNLCFIAGGRQVKDPSELLSNGMFKKLLDRVAPAFDWVLLDSPPCLPVADSTMLADLCDGVLLVVQAGKTPTELAQKACQELQGKNIVGVVLNAIEASHLWGTYYYQGYGYNYGHNQVSEEARA